MTFTKDNASELGRKGGSRKGMKGANLLKTTDPTAYRLMQKRRIKAFKKTMEEKRNTK